MTNNEAIYKLIETLGNDAKTVFITYLILDYGSLLIIVGLISWGIRAVWKKRAEWSLWG